MLPAKTHHPLPVIKKWLEYLQVRPMAHKLYKTERMFRHCCKRSLFRPVHKCMKICTAWIFIQCRFITTLFQNLWIQICRKLYFLANMPKFIPVKIARFTVYFFFSWKPETDARQWWLPAINQSLLEKSAWQRRGLACHHQKPPVMSDYTLQLLYQCLGGGGTPLVNKKRTIL